MTRVAAIIHDADHYYAVLEIFVTPKCIVIYDGLSRELLQWIDYVVCAMKCCMLIPLEADYVACADNPTMRMATALASALASTSMVMTAMRRVLRVLLLNHHTVTVSV